MAKLPEFKQMSDERTVDFFQKAKSCVSASGAFVFGKVRALLTDSLTESERHSQITAVRGQFLPLSVYENQGFDVKQIAAKAESRESAMCLV